MDDIERMMSNLPRLKHFELVANCHNDVVNGHRWQIKAKCLITFNFTFDLSAELEAQDLDSFRSSFWVEEKGWFVAYRRNSLFSVPRFNQTKAFQNFRIPLYSTVPNHKIFYQSVERLNIGEILGDQNHYFPHVKTLSIRRPILLPTIEKVVNLSYLQYLILHLSMENFPIMNLINQSPNMRQLALTHNVKNFLKQVDGQTIEKIKTLEINNSLKKTDNYTVEKLSNVFPNIEHLHIAHTCSIKHILDLLDRFKHLTTASFQYTSLFANEEVKQKCRLKIHSALNRIGCSQDFHYTYRFDSSSVHIWI
jgi:hypothetical protein